MAWEQRRVKRVRDTIPGRTTARRSHRRYLTPVSRDLDQDVVARTIRAGVVRSFGRARLGRRRESMPRGRDTFWARFFMQLCPGSLGTATFLTLCSGASNLKDFRL